MVNKAKIKLLVIIYVSLMIFNYCIVMAQDVVISSGVIISTDVYGTCDLSDNRNSIVINNSLRIEDRNIQGNAYGGYSREGKVQENILEMTGGTINESAYGGYGDQDAMSNILKISDGNVQQSAYGGYSYSGSAQGNVLEMTGGTINESAYGGYGEQETINNILKIINGNIQQSAHGGYSYSGSAQGNVLEMTGGTINESAYGGYGSQEAINNTLKISDGSIRERAYGGYSDLGKAHGNILEMTGGTISIHAHGGRGEQEAINNTLKIAGGNIYRHAYGGYSSNVAIGVGRAEGNVLEVTEGTVGENVYGGISYEESINNNVIIRGGKFGGDIYVGYSENGRAVGNRLEISGTPEFSINTHIYGGFSRLIGADILTGNVLDVKTNSIEVAGIGGFQYINFYNPPKDGNPVITCTTDRVNINNVKIAVKVDADEDVNTANSKYFLIRSMGGLDGSIKEEVKVKHGLLSIYDASIFITNFTELGIVIKSGYANPRAAIITQSKAATLEIVNGGLDLIIEKGIETTREANTMSESLVPFIALRGGKSKLSTGWDINLAGLGVLVGVTKEINKEENKITIGGFVEHGRKTSDMSEEIEGGKKVSAGLSGEYNGCGVLARMGMYANSYIEGSLRGGGYKVESDIYNLDQDNPQKVTYDYSAMYLGGHVGIGYMYKINDEFNIDMSSKFLLMYQEGKDLKLSSGDNIKFRDIETGKVRVGTKVDYTGKQVLPYIGINYEYEVLAKEIRAKTVDIDLPEVDVKRGRVVGEVGIGKEIGKFKIDGSVMGYMGSKEGYDAMLKIKFCFNRNDITLTKTRLRS